MDLVKQYIAQTISDAANNLRLSSEKIEVVALLREAISESDNISEDLKRMKKVTELSTLAIRLHRTYIFLTEEKIDFSKLSDIFKGHSKYLINDLNHMLEMVNPKSFKQIMLKVKGEEEKTRTKIVETENAEESEEISVDLSKRKSDEHVFEIDSKEEIEKEKIETKEKEEGILSDEYVEYSSYEEYEKTMLKSIKDIEVMLQNISHKEVERDKIDNFVKLLKRSNEASRRIGFNIITSMHAILIKSLTLIKEGTLKPNIDVVEAMRACLIVIAAVIKGKDIDISSYLNKAEELGRSLKNNLEEERKK